MYDTVGQRIILIGVRVYNTAGLRTIQGSGCTIQGRCTIQGVQYRGQGVLYSGSVYNIGVRVYNTAGKHTI